MFQGMAEKNSFTDKRSKNKQDIDDWMRSPSGGYVLGGILVAIIVWAVVSQFI